MHNNIYLQLNKYKQLASTTIGSEQWRRWGAGRGRGGLVVGLLRGAVVGGVAAGLLRNGLAWRDLRAVLRWRGFRAAGWGRGGACTPWRGLRAARRRRWGLARLEGRDMGIGIMWWRGGGLRSRRVG